jgi:hypothetical protein
MSERRTLAIERCGFFQRDILVRLHREDVGRIGLTSVNPKRFVANRDALASL